MMVQARFNFIKNHKRIDTTVGLLGDQGIGDLVLDIAR